MNRPRIFLSAVSTEFRTTRQAVAKTVRTLGFDPVSQDDFPTGHGELRQWLREQVDSCEGIIQIAGQGYGAEPLEVDPEFGRVSYTQYEFLYALRQKKKTWLIIAGEGCHRDTPLDRLDRPDDPYHPDPDGAQADRRKLQQDYLARLQRVHNHLWHQAGSDLELENVVLRLRDELGLLRRKTERQQRRVAGTLAALLAVCLVLGAGGWWGYQQLHRDAAQARAVDVPKIRSHLLQTVEETHRRELAEAEKATDWKQRQRMKDGAEAAHTTRLARIDELAASFAEIEGRGGATTVFQEMGRILSEQGVDEAITYVGSQRSKILCAVQSRAAAARERNRAELQPLLTAAALHENRGQNAEARGFYRDILTAEPDWPDALEAAFRFLTRKGDAAVTYTTLAAAQREYEEAQRLVQRLVSSNSTNANWQRNLTVSLNKVGDVQNAQGELPNALKSYQTSLDIRRTLAAQDHKNAGWQRDLAVSLDKVGDVQQAQGELPAALNSYQASLDIMRTLAAQGPRNAGRQRDLAVSLIKVGDVQQAQGELPTALKSYQAGLDIMRTLAAQDPRNAAWQRDLSVSFDRVGDVQQDQGELPAALKSHQASLDIMRTLAAQDPKNAGWQLDLATCLDRVGNVQNAQGDLPAALNSYQASLDIMRNLAAQDPKNAGWHRNLTVSLIKVGTVQEAQGELPAALKSYQTGLDIMRTLAAQDPKNAGWQLDLATCLDRVGDVQNAQGDLPAALNSYQASLDIMRRLAAQDPQNAGWQRDLCVSFERMGLLAMKRKGWQEGRDWFLQELTIANRIFADSIAAEAIPFRVNVLNKLIACDLAIKDYETALAHQQSIVSLNRQAQNTANLAAALYTQGQIAHATKRYSEAFEAVSESLAIAAKLNDINEQWLSNANGVLCCLAVLSGKHTEAVAAGEKAVGLLKDKKPCPVRMNLAHALLFDGQFEKAHAIYAKYAGQAFEDGRKWNDKVLDDFKTLREIGITHPDMEKIEGLLKRSL